MHYIQIFINNTTHLKVYKFNKILEPTKLIFLITQYIT